MSWKTRLARTPLLWRFAPRSPSPVAWAGLGPLTRLLGRLQRPLAPPLLVLSLPRSGSSWVGEILGHAGNALYLREPVTQSLMQRHGLERALLSADEARPLQARYAARAFAGLPEFDPGIVIDPGQWDLAQRRTRRPVIKEVNPLAAGWYLQAFAPRLLFIVRHPAAVASSFQRLGWQADDLSAVRQALRDLPLPAAARKALEVDGGDFWYRQGLMQGGALFAAWQALREAPDCRVLRYEALCAAPLEGFRALFGFAGLDWQPADVERITTKSRGDGDPDAYATERDSRRMRDAWRSRVGATELQRLGEAWQSFDLPWYRQATDWTLQPAEEAAG
ncbi:sulfotransferase [Thiohalobacter sp. IOR34]|uniref:sulfotransferase n=1 Tax=Thiohalobacter sp. IOR34 TaxID=3057176 RepID=UPI0025B1F084|nr:sulfotransferase [Thiohalobacter sp. IOR34]WJW74438.1 sulfotransferase [Thiohalobacter sp. IOR34]